MVGFSRHQLKIRLECDQEASGLGYTVFGILNVEASPRAVSAVACIAGSNKGVAIVVVRHRYAYAAAALDVMPANGMR